ncbi:hypothetical protein SAMN05216414_101273 [Nitrosovibrio sp. Nv17]|nr:hypothetical protein SAMN05216414_101273 [Nitrosovibrio sp. Nv17]
MRIQAYPGETPRIIKAFPCCAALREQGAGKAAPVARLSCRS